MPCCLDATPRPRPVSLRDLGNATLREFPSRGRHGRIGTPFVQFAAAASVRHEAATLVAGRVGDNWFYWVFGDVSHFVGLRILHQQGQEEQKWQE